MVAERGLLCSANTALERPEKRQSSGLNGQVKIRRI